MNTWNFTRLLSVLMTLIFFGACEKDTPPIVDYDYTYIGENYEINAATELALRNTLSELVSEMKKGRTGNTLDYTQLLNLYQSGTPSLATVSTPYYQNRIEETGGWLQELSKASGGTYIPGSPQGEGGIYGGYLFDENGLELEQVVEKGLFAAAMYRYATEILDGSHDETTADRVLALYGAHPSFSNSDNAGQDHPDVFSAKYTARRDKNDGAGMYDILKSNFTILQTAIRVGEDLQGEKQTAIAGIKLVWEKAIYATVVNYLHAAISKLSSTNPSETDIASALHAYGEAVGFVHGWREIPASQRLITDIEVEEILESLNAPYNAAPSSYLFVTDPVNELPKLTQVIAKIQGIYNFTDQEIQDFKENWVSKQGR